MMDFNSMPDEDTQHGRFLTFALGKETFGLEIAYVKEIVGLQPITLLPDAPEYIKGIINLRGKIIPVIDARMRFGMEHSDYSDRTCIIVIEINEVFFGLIVDNVSEVQSIDDSNITPPPAYSTSVKNSIIKAIGKVGNEVKLLLDCSKLFLDGDLDELVQQTV